MIGAGRLKRSVTFRRQTTDADGEAAGYEDAFTRAAAIEPLRGSETVQAARMAGKQPIRMTVYRDSETKLIDNGWQAKDAHAAAEVPPRIVVWDILSAQESADMRLMEIEAVQRKGGDVS